ncbi:IclR family transcriptional regulator [Aeromicrobium wangtongii]|uniref:IclR family transcriptional regulator n=1 Tax=Aeromicrobium wangtongii TaxID=2969247 RepID=UPI002017052F|nr:IclR family transcriptional regulator [Aeromicrobium wangtongii]MCL3819396.1 IclR family transcriptional regulator [Aeromicrobium wangtongii]
MTTTTVLADPVVTLAEEPSGQDVRSGLNSVGKALALLEAFNPPAKLLGVTELAIRAGLPKSTAHRLLAVLHANDYVRRVGNQYCLSERMFELGNQTPMCRPSGIREKAAPVMAELMTETGETINLAIRVDDEALYVDKVQGRRTLPWSTRVGARSPLHCTGLGKALLAFGDPQTDAFDPQNPLARFTPYTLFQPGRLMRALETIRAEGVAIDQEEFRQGMTCLAAPIFDRMTGNVVAAISISTITGARDVRRFAPQLLRAASQISGIHTARVVR